MHVLKFRALTPAAQAEIRRISKRLYEIKRRCGPKANGSDKWHYRDVRYELPEPPRIAAMLTFDQLGPLPPGMSLDRINPAGPYSLDNLRYATPASQTANRVLWRR
jgi:hypothetical protein